MKHWRRWVPLSLALVGVMITAIAAIPEFLQLRKSEPRIEYTVSTAALSIPGGSREREILTTLREAGIATGTTVVEITNVGNAAAEDVRIAVEVGGPIVEIRTTPTREDDPVWVRIESAMKLDDDPDSARLRLSDLTIGRPFRISVEYHRTFSSVDAVSTVQIVADGKAAFRTDSFELATSESRFPWVLVFTPLLVGLWFGSFAALLQVARRRPDSPTIQILILALRLLFPPAARLLKGNPVLVDGWRDLRNELAWQLAVGGLSLRTFHDGAFGADEPEAFWDIVAEAHGKIIGIAVQSWSQARSFGFAGSPEEQRQYLLYCLARGSGMDAVAVHIGGTVNAEALERLESAASELNAGDCKTRVFLSASDSAELATTLAAWATESCD